LRNSEFEAQHATQPTALAYNNINQVSHSSTTTTHLSNPSVAEISTAATKNMDSPSK